MTVLAVRAPIAWLGPGRLAEDIAIVLQGGRVAFAGPARDLAVTAAGERGRETLSGHPAPPEPDQEIRVDGFVIPGVVDRHVHIGLSDPGAVVAAGVTAVRDLGWPPEVAFPLADASESPSFNGPLIRAVGPMITCRGGYPTRSGWAPPGTGREVDGPNEASRATREILGRSGVAVVKVALNVDAGQTLSDEELVAVCDAAHQADAIVTAHCQGKGQVERALGAGVDELAHCPWTERLSEDTIGRWRDAFASCPPWTSTLTGGRLPSSARPQRTSVGSSRRGGESSTARIWAMAQSPQGSTPARPCICTGQGGPPSRSWKPSPSGRWPKASPPTWWRWEEVRWRTLQPSNTCVW